MLYTEPLPTAVAAVAGVACLVLALLGWRLLRRRRAAAGSDRAGTAKRPEGQALLTRYHPNAVRVLTASEREAFDLVRDALPDHFVMAQVPLVRYLRVQDKRTEDDWLRGLSMLSADILVCDTSSRPLLAIDILPPKQGARSRERHDRMLQLLEGVGIRVVIWQEGRLPVADQVRVELLAALQARKASAAAPARSATAPAPLRRAVAQGPAATPRVEPELGPVDAQTSAAAHGAPSARGRAASAAARASAVAPLIPVPEISELLAEGDEIVSRHRSNDPVSLTFFDEFDARPHAPAAPMH